MPAREVPKKRRRAWRRQYTRLSLRSLSSCWRSCCFSMATNCGLMTPFSITGVKAVPRAMSTQASPSASPCRAKASCRPVTVTRSTRISPFTAVSTLRVAPYSPASFFESCVISGQAA